MKDDWIDEHFPMRDGKIDWNRFYFTKHVPIPLHCWDNEVLPSADRQRIRDRLEVEWQKLSPAEQTAARNSSKS